IHSAEKVGDKSEQIIWPAVSLVGAATPESFFGAFNTRDIDGGLANRMLPLPFEGLVRPPEQDVPRGASEPPSKLVEMLKMLPHLPDLLDRPRVPKRLQIEWGPGASARYFEFSRRMDKYEGDRQRAELAKRACENAVRLATNVAVGRGSPTVDLEDSDWGMAGAERSFAPASGGIARYMQEYLEFPKFCDRVAEAFAHRGFISKRDLNREFFRKMRMGFELERVVEQLIKQGRIRKATRIPESCGHAA